MDVVPYNNFSLDEAINYHLMEIDKFPSNETIAHHRKIISWLTELRRLREAANSINVLLASAGCKS